MLMSKSKYILFILFVILAAGASAQKIERDYIRKGNRLFNDSVFVDAEVNYRKALEVNPKSTVSMYNLGNTLSQQQKFKDAMEQYVAAGKIEKDKMKLAHIYHNMGVLFQAGKDYAQAVEAYKMSLRNNPKDDETRYNLALAQKMLKPRHFRAGHQLPLCAGSGNAGGHHGRQRSGCKERHPVQDRRFAGSCRPHPDRGAGQDRHHHQR